MSTWNDIEGLSGLTLAFSGSDSQHANIYGNGLNQVAVTVTLKPVRRVSNALQPLQVSWREMLPHVYLCDYYTGERLHLGAPGSSGSDLGYTDTKNDYCRAIDYSPVSYVEGSNDQNGADTVIFYVYAGAQLDGRKIAAGFDLPNGNSLSTQEQSGSSTLVKHLTVSAQQPIDYSKPECWEIIDSPGGFTEVAGDINVKSKQKAWIGGFSDNHWGISQYKKVRIRCKSPTLRLTKDRIVTGDRVSKISYATFVSGPVSGPHAVSSWSGNNSDTFIWFVEPADAFGVEAGSMFKFQASNHWYEFTIGSSDVRHRKYPDAFSDDAISVYLLNLRIPDDNIHADGWSDEIHDAYVSVSDQYGNHGRLKISFRYDRWLPFIEG